MGVSNQDLKHFSKSDLLGFAGAVFHGFLPPEGDLTTKLTKKLTLLTPKSDIFEKVYTSDPKSDILEKAYTSDEQMIFSKKFTLLTQKVIFRNSLHF